MQFEIDRAAKSRFADEGMATSEGRRFPVVVARERTRDLDRSKP